MSEPTRRHTPADRARRAALADAASDLAVSPACALTGDTAYQTLLDHTLSCPDCKTSGGKCGRAADLDRAWRQARGAAPLGQLYRRPAARPSEGGTMTNTPRQTSDGKHGGPPSDKPWPVPEPAPSPDGSRPQKHTPQP